MELKILNRNLYRTSKTEDQDKPAITIPFSMIRHVINTHEKQQSYQDISHDIKKCAHDEGDFYNKNKEDVAGEIECLKRPRIEEN